MLWVALHFPQFRRQALSRGHALPEPEREALAAVAVWAGQFTPRVSLEPPQALLLEVEGSLRYFGGRWKFLARLRAGLTDLGFEARLGEAPTARAALWLARGGGSRLEALPVAVLGLEAPQLELLAGLGIGTVGGLLRLPRDGIARRFGVKLLAELDRARGSAAESRSYFALPAHFDARLVLPAPVSQAQSTLFAAGRLLRQMEGFLTARHAGVREFCLALEHEDRRGKIAPTDVRVLLVGPARAEQHFVRLLRERFGALVLKAPVEAIRLSADRLAPLPASNGHLLHMPHDPRAGGEEWLRLIERLQARLGSAAVHGLDTQEDHRPERAWLAVSPGKEWLPEGKGRHLPRPLWLLDPPRRLAEGEFALLAGPERIDSGWWDGAEARRDYFIARTGQCALAWIYRERAEQRREGWFLHGYFA